MKHQASAYLDSLTPRELEILYCLAEGLSNEEISLKLSIAPTTIKWYIRQLNSKLATTNREEIIKRAIEIGLLKTTPASGYILPKPSTPFVGRNAEIDSLYAMLTTPTFRLITILAPGGMGKTRLALEIASYLGDVFRDGVYFVSLQALTEISHFLTTLASTIGLAWQGYDPIKQQLLRYLSNKEMLLVLDSCEALPEIAGLIAEMLQTAPALKILATSREKLNLLTETLYGLYGLTFANGDDFWNEEAVQLLTQTAKRIKPRWIPDDDQRESITKICQLTGGMPLGIVLAVQWLDLLSLEEIAAEIQHNIDLLTTELQDVPPRQRSIRAIFNTAWQRLSPTDQVVYARLSVFRGGFTREAAEHVAEATLRCLLTFYDKSLIQSQQPGRFHIHDLLRFYAQEHLSAEENFSTQEKHAVYYAQLVQRCELRIKNVEQFAAFQDIEADFENIRAAWNWNVDYLHFTLLDHMVFSIEFFHLFKGNSLAGKLFFESAVEKLATLSDAAFVYVKIATYYAWYCLDENLTQQGHDLLKSCLTLARALHDAETTAVILHILAFQVAQLEQGRVFIEESIQIFRTLGDRWWLTVALNIKAYLMIFQPYSHQERLALTNEIVEIRREMGDKLGLSATLNNLGILWFEYGEPDMAIACFEECQAIRREAGISQNSSYIVTLNTLAAYYVHIADFEKAEAMLNEAIAIAQKLHLYPHEYINSYYYLALIAGFKGNLEKYHALLKEADEFVRNPQIPVVQQRLWVQRQRRILQGSVVWCADKFDEARTIFQSLLREFDEQPHLNWFHLGMVKINLCLLDLEQALLTHAQAPLEQLLHDAVQFKVRVWMLSILYGYALIAHLAGRLAEAVFLATLVKQHKATSYDVRLRTAQLLGLLQKEVSSFEFGTAVEQGLHADLEAVAYQLLKKSQSALSG